jgi:kynurenine formamidase
MGPVWLASCDLEFFMQKDKKLRDIMIFPYKLIDLTHELDSAIPTWNGGCGFNHDVHVDYSDCQGEDKFRFMKVKMHAGIGTHMDAPSHCYS